MTTCKVLWFPYWVYIHIHAWGLVACTNNYANNKSNQYENIIRISCMKCCRPFVWRVLFFSLALVHPSTQFVNIVEQSISLLLDDDDAFYWLCGNPLFIQYLKSPFQTLFWNRFNAFLLIKVWHACAGMCPYKFLRNVISRCPEVTCKLFEVPKFFPKVIE